jgi:DNA-binding LytR/AlgR family response regulator
MIPLKAALLDDNKEQLLKNQQYLEKAGLVTVVTACASAEVFLTEVKQSQPEVLFLDLNLGDTYMTGMEVAFELQIPVLFVSSNTSQYVKEMEQLKRQYNLCVDHITKPFTEDEFVKTTERFLKEIHFFAKEEFVYLDFGSNKRNKINLNTIVYLEADKAHGSQSNNKTIYFKHRKVEKLIDFSFTKMEEKGLYKSKFITIHKSIRVNKQHIKLFDKIAAEIEVDIFDISGKVETKRLPVSHNYLTEVKQFKK